MRRIVLVLSLFLLGVLLVGSVFSEPYNGSAFPPDGVIKNAVRFYNGTLGKFLDNNGVYHFFYKEGIVARKALVYKLDTGIWVVEEEGELTLVDKEEER